MSDLTSEDINADILAKWREHSDEELSIIHASLRDWKHESEYLISNAQLLVQEIEHLIKLRKQQNYTGVKQ